VKAISPNKLGYKDNLTKKRQRRFLVSAVALAVGSVVLVVALGYVIFFSGWFTIRNVSAGGLSDSRKAQVLDVVHQQLTHRWLGLPTGDNILFFPSSRIQASLRNSFSFIDTVSIKKKFFHSLILTAVERQPEGIWCFGSASLTTSCFYYDHKGILIADAPRSSGFLMLTVNDARENTSDIIDPKFLIAIQTILPALDAQGIKVKNINIPTGTFTELDVATGNGYPVKFSIDSDLAGQLHALDIFRKQHSDPIPPYQYLDLRFDGRVYFK